MMPQSVIFMNHLAEEEVRIIVALYSRLRIIQPHIEALVQQLDWTRGIFIPMIHLQLTSIIIHA